MNAAADAAALAALTPAMLQQSSTVAQTPRVSLFNGLTEGIPGLTANATQVTVTITVGSNALTRNVAVAYSSSVNTIFAQVLGQKRPADFGLSQASAQAPPNIDFYVLLDNSPSMALPVHAGRHNQMQNLTTKQTREAARSRATRRAPTMRHGGQSLRGTTHLAPRRQNRAAILRRHTARRSTTSQLARKNNITSPPGRIEQWDFDAAPNRVDTSQSTVFATPPKYRFCDLLHG